MKSKYLLLSLVLAFGMLTTSQGQTLTGSAGDLILAFRTTDNSIQENLEVDLGPYTQFTNLSPGATLNLNLNGSHYGATNGLAAPDIATVYGSNWFTLTNLAWSVAGVVGSSAATDLYATFSAANGLLVNQASGSTQNTAGARLRALLGGLNGVPTLSSPGAAEIAVNTSAQSNYTGSIRGAGLTKDYNYFSKSTETLYNGSGTSSLDLFELIHGNTGPGADLGTFTLDSAGNFNFAASSVPEPSTYAALLMGGASLLWAHRRRPRN